MQRGGRQGGGQGSSPQMDSRARVNAALVVCGILVGFGITSGILLALGWHPSGTPDPGRGPSAIRSLTQKAGDGPSPKALDSEWLDYSDHSTCAGRAGGDGVSAVKPGSSQDPRVFARTYPGPARATIRCPHPGAVPPHSRADQATP